MLTTPLHLGVVAIEKEALYIIREREREVWFGLICPVLWHINLCRLFNAKYIFIQIVLFQKIQFSYS